MNLEPIDLPDLITVPIIFVDANGVLNRWGTPLNRGDKIAVEPSCVEALKRLVEETNGQIVFTSTLRHEIGRRKFISLLGDWSADHLANQWRLPGIGWGSKGKLIGQWFEEAWLLGMVKELTDIHVILDDEDDGFQADAPLVRTSAKVGLCDANVDTALAKLRAQGWSK